MHRQQMTGCGAIGSLPGPFDAALPLPIGLMPSTLIAPDCREMNRLDL